MEKTLIIALHGFLGLPSDWEQWHQRNAPHHQILTPSLWSDPLLNCNFSFNEWTHNFISAVTKFRQQGFQVELWGYSMGGRLALHALMAAPDLFKKAMIISANPGLETEELRTDRLKKDLIWSEKFATQEWNSLMQEWNQQPVLLESAVLSPKFQRHEVDFNRLSLSKALNHWSIARQKNFWPELSSLKLPIEWHVGALDSIYLNMAQRAAQLNPHIQLMIHENSGHRLL